MTREAIRNSAISSMGSGDPMGSNQPGRTFVRNTRTSSGVRRRNQKSPGGWLFSPGGWEPFAEGYRALVAISPADCLIDGELGRVQVGGFMGERRVYFWPTRENDVDGIEVKRRGSQVRINIANFLATIGQRPEVGLAQRFDLVEADEDAPVKPALMINLDKPLERKYFETTRKKGSGAQSKGGTRTGPSKGGGGAESADSANGGSGNA